MSATDIAWITFGLACIALMLLHLWFDSCMMRKHYHDEHQHETRFDPAATERGVAPGSRCQDKNERENANAAGQ